MEFMRIELGSVTQVRTVEAWHPLLPFRNVTGVELRYGNDRLTFRPREPETWLATLEATRRTGAQVTREVAPPWKRPIMPDLASRAEFVLTATAVLMVVVYFVFR